MGFMFCLMCLELVGRLKSHTGINTKKKNHSQMNGAAHRRQFPESLMIWSSMYELSDLTHWRHFQKMHKAMDYIIEQSPISSHLLATCITSIVVERGSYSLQMSHFYSTVHIMLAWKITLTGNLSGNTRSKPFCHLYTLS